MLSQILQQFKTLADILNPALAITNSWKEILIKFSQWGTETLWTDNGTMGLCVHKSTHRLGSNNS